MLSDPPLTLTISLFVTTLPPDCYHLPRHSSLYENHRPSTRLPSTLTTPEISPTMPPPTPPPNRPPVSATGHPLSARHGVQTARRLPRIPDPVRPLLLDAVVGVSVH